MDSNAWQHLFIKKFNLYIMTSMDFSKSSIVSHHFSKKAFGGLNEFEVRDYLNVLAEEILRLQEQTLQQERQIREQKETIEDCRDREQILKESITVVQKITEKIRKDAETQSEMILQSAHDKKDLIIREARESLQSIYDDIAELKRFYIQFKTNLTASIKAHLEMLEKDSPVFSSLLGSSDSSEEETERGNPSVGKSGEEVASLQELGLESEASADSKMSEKESPSPEEEEADSLAKSLKSLSEDFL